MWFEKEPMNILQKGCHPTGSRRSSPTLREGEFSSKGECVRRIPPCGKKEEILVFQKHILDAVHLENKPNSLYIIFSVLYYCYIIDSLLACHFFTILLCYLFISMLFVFINKLYLFKDINRLESTRRI